MKATEAFIEPIGLSVDANDNILIPVGDYNAPFVPYMIDKVIKLDCYD